jgi:hypothetical protein
MYPHWRALLPDLTRTQKITLGVFSYGFYRGATADYRPPFDLIGERVIFSFLNGSLYLFPPYGLFRMGSVINRIHVSVAKKDPKQYPMIYEEVFGLGHNERVL